MRKPDLGEATRVLPELVGRYLSSMVGLEQLLNSLIQDYFAIRALHEERQLVFREFTTRVGMRHKVDTLRTIIELEGIQESTGRLVAELRDANDFRNRLAHGSVISVSGADVGQPDPGWPLATYERIANGRRFRVEVSEVEFRERIQTVNDLMHRVVALIDVVAADTSPGGPRSQPPGPPDSE